MLSQIHNFSQIGLTVQSLALAAMIAVQATSANAQSATFGSEQAASSQPVLQSCSPRILADKTVATAAQRLAAGKIAKPPLTDQANGFAWPDTPLGVVKGDGGYLFFGSDGGHHARQSFDGHEYGNDKSGSITRTVGTLDKPLGSEPPIDVTIDANPDPSVNPYYSRYDYMGGGPVYRVPAGLPGAGNLLMVYHAEIPTMTQSFDSVYALASSSDNGMSWMDLGEIVRINQAYRTDMDGFEIGDAPLVVSPGGQYFYIYFRDWLANGTPHWGSTVTQVSVARASIASVLGNAFGEHPRAVAFQKFYLGFDLDQGLGGYSQDLDPDAPFSGESQVAYNSHLRRYQMIVGEGVLIAYSESLDGLHWSSPILLKDFRGDSDQPWTYVMPVGMGPDPRILGKEFYLFYTRNPTTGAGWPGATVHRLTVECQ
jgi:hypothetical protein